MISNLQIIERMSLKAQIEGDIKKAMLAKQKEELKALRAIKSMILLAETEKGAAGDISTDAEMKLLMKAVKQRKDSTSHLSRASSSRPLRYRNG